MSNPKNDSSKRPQDTTYLREVVGDTEPKNRLLDSRPSRPGVTNEDDENKGPRTLHN
jgi:hypothetical protein